MPKAIVAIEEQIQQGNVISESDMLSYINAKSVKKRKDRAQAQEIYPFTLIWYNHKKSRSEMLHTHAKNSVDAITENQEHYPQLANVSAYPLHLPKTLQFVPDEMMVPSS